MPELQIGDQANAIILLQSTQTDPQKAVAEFVENSIDAKAKNIKITRERRSGHMLLSVSDDGQGVPVDSKGEPDILRVAQSIANSVKRYSPAEERDGIQGQFGIGILGFAAVGELFHLRSRGQSGVTRGMSMKAFEAKWDPDPSPTALKEVGTRVEIVGVRRDVQNRLTAEKLQRYLSEELRDRIRKSGVRVVIEDRVGAKKTLVVTPKEFHGVRLQSGHKEIQTSAGLLKIDLYATFIGEGQTVSVAVARRGTRLLPDLTECEELQHAPWNQNILEGFVDLEGLKPSPATRRGFQPDEAYEMLVDELVKLEPSISFEIEQLRKKHEEKISREVLERLRQAFADAMEELTEDYSWFERSGSDLKVGDPRLPLPPGAKPKPVVLSAGPLEQVRLTPKIAVIGPEETKVVSAKCFDPQGALIPSGVSFSWWTSSTLISLRPSGQVATVAGGDREGEALVRVTARSKGVERIAECKVVITRAGNQFGFPPPDLLSQPLEHWRSRYIADRGILEVNSGHRDYERSKKGGSKSEIRYLSKLYAKELVLLNLGRAPSSQVLEAMIELTSVLESKL